jgi:hypothetical protein
MKHCDEAKRFLKSNDVLKPENDLDYLRACVELDPEFATQTIPAFRTPYIGFYYLEKPMDNRYGPGVEFEIKTWRGKREEALKKLLDPNFNIVGLQ